VGDSTASAAVQPSLSPLAKGLTPGTLRSYFRPPPKALRNGAPGDHRRASRGTFALLIRRQTRSSRGVKDVLVTGITVTMLLTSAATASAQNIFEALFGRVAPSPGPVPDANFTARDKEQLANPPYQQVWIPPAYQRQLVQYHRKDAPGSILIDTDGRYVYYVLPGGKAIRYGAIVGEDGQAWSGVATVGRKEEWPGWTPTEGEKRRLGPLPNYVEGGARNPMGARALYLYAGGKDTLYRIHGTNQPGWIGHAISSGCIRLTNEDVIDLYSRVKVGALVVVLGPKQGLSRVAAAGGSDPN
jgi:lipoprotein-anchoring transpeptidase ErfK/SrfK